MAEKTGRVDRAAICLGEWCERARGYHTPVWEQWTIDTQAALEQHNRDRAEMIRALDKAKWALLDHDILSVAAHLNELGELLR